MWGFFWIFLYKKWLIACFSGFIIWACQKGFPGWWKRSAVIAVARVQFPKWHLYPLRASAPLQGSVVLMEAIITVKSDRKVTCRNCDTASHFLVGGACLVVKVLRKFLAMLPWLYELSPWAFCCIFVYMKRQFCQVCICMKCFCVAFVGFVFVSNWLGLYALLMNLRLWCASGVFKSISVFIFRKFVCSVTYICM